jgi:hypothetical protein
VGMYGDEVAAFPTLSGDHRRQVHNEIARSLVILLVRPEFPPLASHRSCLCLASLLRFMRGGKLPVGLHNMVPDLLLTGVPPLQSTISGGIGLGTCRDAILDMNPVESLALQFKNLNLVYVVRRRRTHTSSDHSTRE